MYIDSIDLNNFRIYKGENKISFIPSTSKNIYVIAGNNGYGKTTFLTSLIWCLYGKQMIDVDEKFKREITDSYGYKKFAKSNLNSIIQKQSNDFALDDKIKKNIFKNGYKGYDEKILKFKSLNEYSVTISLSNLYIPSVPCEKVTIKRTFDVFREIENIQILIDNREIELIKEVGPDIFINDFILSKDIAKFFFFDSEKIVSLAEMKTLEEKRKLSIAYSEVLGVKKYEDLKNNLENLRIKLRRKSADIADKNKLNKLIKDNEDSQKLIDHLSSTLENNDTEILTKRQIVEQYQEKLIREGNSISLSELINLKSLRDELKAKDIILKTKLKELLDLAPFAIAGKKFTDSYNQMLNEQKKNFINTSSTHLNNSLKNIEKELSVEFLKNNLTDEISFKFSEIISKTINKYIIESENKNEKAEIILNFSDNEQDEFKSIYENIKYSFNQVFKQLVKDERNNRNFLLKTTRKIIQAESNENDLLIKEIRTAKSKVEKQLLDIEKENRKLSEDIGSFQKELNIRTKIINELSKRVSIDESDKLKDETAERLINELNKFLIKLKSEKKASLEISIRHELNKLMHKSDFINKVLVEILDDIIDIKLFDKDNEEINKDKLSKGEQQLYATAILKALVDESEIKFPIFIDSPLQKFDKKHSNKIISEFYPKVSEQVVLFPLLEKELTEIEYKKLIPFVMSAFIIQNDSKSSLFQEVEPKKLFKVNSENYVYTT